MSHLVNNIANLGRKINKYDPVDRAVQNFVLGKPVAGTNYYGQAGPAAPVQGVPQIDESARNRQALDRLQRRRGVYANLYGGQSNAQPATAGNTLLGS